jgi:hypothetical protein
MHVIKLRIWRRQDRTKYDVNIISKHRLPRKYADPLAIKLK